MSERNEVSVHEVKVFRALESTRDTWRTNREIAEIVSGVSYRTVRAHTMKLVRAGILDQADVFPAHKYRLSAQASKRNVGYWRRLQAAAEVFGL